MNWLENLQLRRERRRVIKHRSLLEQAVGASDAHPEADRQIAEDTARIREIEEKLGITYPIQSRQGRSRVIDLDDIRKRKGR